MAAVSVWSGVFSNSGLVSFSFFTPIRLSDDQDEWAPLIQDVRISVLAVGCGSRWCCIG